MNVNLLSACYDLILCFSNMTMEIYFIPGGVGKKKNNDGCLSNKAQILNVKDSVPGVSRSR